MTTKRLIIRNWNLDDAINLYKYASDPSVGIPAGWCPHKSIEESKNFIKDADQNSFAVCLKSDNLAIGSICLKLKDKTDMTDRDDECELGYWIGKPFWGQGLIPEAVNEIVRYAFENLNMKKIWCGRYEGNERSKRVQEKCGFHYKWTTYDVDVPMLNEKRVGYVSCLEKSEWNSNK